MQRTMKEYDPKRHDLFRAFTVKQDWGDKILSGEKTIEVRKHDPKYNGIVIVTTDPSEKPRSGITLAKVELYKVKTVKELTPQEWGETGIKEHRRRFYNGYAWFLRNPRPVPPIEVKGKKGLWTLILDKGDLRPKQNKRKTVYIVLAAIIIAIQLLLLFK